MQRIRQRFVGFTAVLLVMFVGSMASVYAACPPGSSFAFKNNANKNLRVSRPDRAIDEGGMSVMMPLNSAIGSISLTPSGPGINTTARIRIGQRAWRLRVPKPTTIDVNDLIFEYRINDGQGIQGQISSISQPASVAPVVIQQRRVTRTDRQNAVIFKGYIDLLVDFSRASYSGGYTGQITSTIDCL